MEKVSYERRQRMNYMSEIAKMLGVEIGEEFKLRPYDKNEVTFSYYLFKRDGLYNPYDKDNYLLAELLLGKYEIIKLPKHILDDEEKKYLSRVIKPWRDKVEYIRKINFDDEDEFIVIIYRERESKAMPLPCFKKGTMYKGMEVGKQYSLEELEL